MSGKDLSAYLKEPAKDEFSLDAMDGIDFDAVADRVDEMQAGGGEAFEPSNACEGGGCII